MKIACTSDWHIHPFKEFSQNKLVLYRKGKKNNEGFLSVPSGTDNSIQVNSRLIDTFNTMKQMRDTCLEEGITTMIVAGDIFHKRGNLATSTLYVAHCIVELFLDKGISLYVLAGNHDQDSNSETPLDNLLALPRNSAMSNATLTIVSEFQDIEFEDCVLRMVAYRHNKELVLPYIREKQEIDVPYVLVAHVGINGAYVGNQVYVSSNDFTINDLDCSDYPYVVLGHFHKPQLLDSTHSHMFYCGSPLQQNFGEEGEQHGFWVIDTDTNKKPTFIGLDYPEFITATTMEEATSIAAKGNYVRLKTSDTSVTSNSKVKVELERVYEAPTVQISLSDTKVAMIGKYAKSKGKPELEHLGFSILMEALGGKDDRIEESES